MVGCHYRPYRLLKLGTKQIFAEAVVAGAVVAGTVLAAQLQTHIFFAIGKGSRFIIHANVQDLKMNV